MPGITPFEAILQGLVGNILARENITNDLLHTLSFGVIKYDPAPGQPDLFGILAAIQASIGDDHATTLAIVDQLITAQASLDALTTAVAALGGPVTLPIDPPAGYGSPDGPTLAGYIWNYTGWSYPRQAWEVLADGAYSTFNQAVIDADITGSAYFIPKYWSTPTSDLSGIHAPTYDPADWLVGESLLDVLTRQNPAAAVAWWDGVGGHVVVYTGLGGAVNTWVTRMDDYEWTAVRGADPLLPLRTSPPAWPGASLVTLGGAVALAEQLTVTAAMDGVLISITELPGRLPAYPFDGEFAYRNLGALAFFTDDGQVEPFQSLGFTHAVFCPRFIVQPAGVKLRLLPGVVGTVTPWAAKP